MRSIQRLQRTVRLPPEWIREIEDEARRLGRSYSWVVQEAWRLAKDRIARMPGRIA